MSGHCPVCSQPIGSAACAANHLSSQPRHTGAIFTGTLVPRRGGWAIDRGQFGVHDLSGFFDPFANERIRVEIRVQPSSGKDKS